MPRRPALVAALGLFILGSLAGLFPWGEPPLSVTERRLLGRWMAPEPNPRAGFVTSKGPVTNPWRVWEFRRDHTFLVRVVSADDPGVSIPDKEGRWSAEGSTLSLGGFGTSGEALRELRERIRVKLGGSYVARTSDSVSHSIRFVAQDTWELTTPRGDRTSWRRRPPR